MGYEKIYIVGKGDGWQDVPEGENVWGINHATLWQPRVNIGFELHSPEVSHRVYKGELSKYINKHKIPMMTKDPMPEFPINYIYPIEEIISKFNSKYFSNSTSYMIAYALYLGVKELSLFGINHNEEWVSRACVEYWLGRCIGSGVRVHLHKKSKLFITPMGRMYGREAE